MGAESEEVAAWGGGNVDRELLRGETFFPTSPLPFTSSKYDHYGHLTHKEGQGFIFMCLNLHKNVSYIEHMS